MKQSQAEQLSIALNSLMDEKGVVGLKIARNKRMIDDELREYYEFKQELFKKYGEERDGQLMISKDSDNIDQFLAELKPLDEQEVDFDFRKITEDELAGSNLTARQMALIWDYMVEMTKGEKQ